MRKAWVLEMEGKGLMAKRNAHSFKKFQKELKKKKKAKEKMARRQGKKTEESESDTE